MFRTIARHEEDGLGLPYPVVLIDAAEEEIDDVSGERLGIVIPDLEALVASIAISRVLDPTQLDGSEVRFIRNVIGMSAKSFAEGLVMDAATLSRWENGKQTVGGWADKGVRMAAIIALAEQASGLSVDPKQVIDLKIHARQEGTWPSMIFRRVHRTLIGQGRNADSWDTQPLAA